MTFRVPIRDMERLMGRIADQIADKVQEQYPLEPIFSRFFTVKTMDFQ